MRQVMFSYSLSGRNLLLYHRNKEQESVYVGRVKEGRVVSLGFLQFCSKKLLSPAITACQHASDSESCSLLCSPLPLLLVVAPG